MLELTDASLIWKGTLDAATLREKGWVDVPHGFSMLMKELGGLRFYVSIFPSHNQVNSGVMTCALNTISARDMVDALGYLLEELGDAESAQQDVV